MIIRIGTFNNENLFFRYRLLDDIPKPFQPQPKPIVFEDMVKQFTIISDLIKEYEDPSKIFEDKKVFSDFLEKLPSKAWKSLLTFMKDGSFNNRLKGSIEDIEPISHTQRSNTASVIYKNKPNFMGVQEIESLPALDEFNYKFISKFHKILYNMLIEGNDPRGIDVGLMNGPEFPVINVKSHRYDKEPDNYKKRVFSRDCLETDLLLSNGKILTVYVNHFKSQIGGGEEKRLQQSKRIKQMITKRFGNDLDGNFIVLGDLNCTPSSPELDPLLKDSKMFNVFENLDEPERWSYLYVTMDKNHEKIKSANVFQYDYILLSQKLVKENPNIKPVVERRGLVYYEEITKKLKRRNEKIGEVYNTIQRFPGVEKYGTEASDHCGIFVDLEI